MDYVYGTYSEIRDILKKEMEKLPMESLEWVSLCKPSRHKPRRLHQDFFPEIRISRLAPPEQFLIIQDAVRKDCCIKMAKKSNSTSHFELDKEIKRLTALFEEFLTTHDLNQDFLQSEKKEFNRKIYVVMRRHAMRVGHVDIKLKDEQGLREKYKYVLNEQEEEK